MLKVIPVVGPNVFELCDRINYEIEKLTNDDNCISIIGINYIDNKTTIIEYYGR